VSRPKARFDDKDRLTIVLKEYDTLRAEIIARMGHGFQTVGFGVTLVVVFIPWLWLHPSDIPYWIALAFGIAVCVFLWSVIHIEIAAAASRLRQIEEIINSMAGDTLLTWETYHGRAKDWVATDIKNV
jgi:hypothetical protein